MSISNKSVLEDKDYDIWDTIEEAMGSVSPKLVQGRDKDDNGEIEIRREVAPLAVTRLGGTLAFDTNSKQLQCSETITQGNNDQNLRLVMEGVITESQREKLMKMRSNPSSVKLVSAAYTGPATFDQIKWDRIADANGAQTRTHGEIKEPLHTVQLQSKENNG